MQKVNINKTLKGNIELRYEGVSTGNIDLDKVNALLDDFINNRKHNSMVENVTVVRTALKGCEENLLEIFCEYEGCSEHVKYDDSFLSLYEKSKKDGIDSYEVKYDSNAGLKIHYKSDDTNLENYKEALEDKIETIQKIHSLSEVKGVFLDSEDKALIETYRLFYNENPDFSKEDIQIKIQTMMHILETFGITIGDDYGFKPAGGKKMPLSLNLGKRIHKLYPLGEIGNSLVNVKLDRDSKRIIKIVGETVREEISGVENQNKALIKISKSIYIGKYCQNRNVKYIRGMASFTDSSYDDIVSSMNLVSRIESKIYKKEL